MKKCVGSMRSSREIHSARGDTLIEVIFAFAILGTIIGFSFTGVIQARRSAISAQQRTQALEIAQYQSEGLQAYRNSIYWDNSQGCPSLFGGSGTTCGTLTSVDLVSNNNRYCMLANAGVWQLLNLESQSSVEACANLVPFLRLDSGRSPIDIQFESIGRLQSSGTTSGNDNNTIQATITIAWTDPFGHDQTVKNIVILTKQK